MDVNFNQLDILHKLISERQDEARLLQAITTQIQTNQKVFDLEFAQIQQSLRQLGFKIISLKKRDKPRQEDENRILEQLARIQALNLPERMYIYKFSQSVIKLFRPDMQIIRFNTKDTRDLLLMYKQFFMADNNLECIHLVHSLMEQEFKMTIAVVLIKQLINKSREEFVILIQQASSAVIAKIKQKLADHGQQQQICHDKTEATEAPQQQPESPKQRMIIVQRPMRKRESTSPRKPVIFRSISLADRSIPKTIDIDRELKLELRAQQKQLRKQLQFIQKPIPDLDYNHIWCSHIVMRKKFKKHPESYFLKRGGFFLWSQLKHNNSYIRQSIQNYGFQRTRIIPMDKITREQMRIIHQIYNTEPTIPIQNELPMIPIMQSPMQSFSSSPIKHKNVAQSQMLPTLSRQSIKPMSLYDPIQKESTNRQNRSLNLSQDVLRSSFRVKNSAQELP